jgi:cytochrome c oxidase subunit III
MSETTRNVKGIELPVNVNNSASTLWWGFVLLIVIELTFFAGIIASYFYLRFHAGGNWPIGHITRPDLLLPSINAVILFVSSYPMYIADSAIQKGNVQKAKIGLAISLVLGVIFLILKGIEYAGYDYTWSSNAYGSIVWTISGFHSAHVIGVVLKVFVVLAAMFKGYYSEERNLGVRVNGLYWHFVVVVWIPLFFTLYLSHYVLP